MEELRFPIVYVLSLFSLQNKKSRPYTWVLVSFSIFVHILHALILNKQFQNYKQIILLQIINSGILLDLIQCVMTLVVSPETCDSDNFGWYTNCTLSRKCHLLNWLGVQTVPYLEKIKLALGLNCRCFLQTILIYST